jgi:hypothetical protein
VPQRRLILRPMKGASGPGESFDLEDYWRSILLFGYNTSTYKMALAESLHHLTMNGHSSVTFAELARQFFLVYRERLQSGQPQLLTPGRQTVMERVMHLVEAGGLPEADAIARIEHEAFGDVVPRFHTVGHGPMGVRFYEATARGLVLTDELYRVLASASGPELRTEALARWDLLEAAFAVRREHSQLHNDLRRFYLSRGYERTDLTPLRPVLHAYQQGACFYCQEPLDVEDSHVDHVIPRQVVYHDGVWNLVLAHSFCNQQKQDRRGSPGGRAGRRRFPGPDGGRWRRRSCAPPGPAS